MAGLNTLTGGPAPMAPIPRAPEVKLFLYRNAVLGDTERFLQLQRYDAHYACEQYEHLKLDWWGANADQMETVSPHIQVPLGFEQPQASMLTVRQKRPTAPYNLGKSIVDRFTGLLFSDSRRPEVMVENDPDTEDYLTALRDQCRFWATIRRARTMGGASGAVAVTAHLRDGKLTLEPHYARNIAAISWKDRETFVPNGMLVMHRYPVIEQAFNEKTGLAEGTKQVWYCYRRIITEEEDTLFWPVKVQPGRPLLWEDPPDRPGTVIHTRVVHNLGFFPGAWVQNLPVSDAEDGDPDCAGAWQALDTADRVLSQVNRAAILNLDPTPVVSADPKLKELELMKGSDNALWVGVGGSANYMEITGGGIDAGLKLFGQLKSNILDVTRCVLADPEKMMGNAQSAKAMELMYEPMLQKADELRAQYGDLLVVPLLHVIERMAREIVGRQVLIKKADGTSEPVELTIDLPPRIEVAPLPDDAPPEAQPQRRPVPRRLGPGGHIRLKWPSYFAPTESDIETHTRWLGIAKTTNLIDEETAVLDFCGLRGIKDPQAVLRKVRKEKEDQMAQSMAAMGGMGGMDGGVPFNQPAPNDNAPTPPAGQGGKP